MKDEEQFMQHYKNYMAGECYAQMPAFNRVGRGPKGDGFDVQCEIAQNGHVVIKGQLVDGYTGEHGSDTFNVDLSEAIPQLQYRLYYPAYRFKNGIPGVVEEGWFIHLRCRNETAGSTMWEFDTPFMKMGEYDGYELPENAVDSWSY